MELNCSWRAAWSIYCVVYIIVYHTLYILYIVYLLVYCLYYYIQKIEELAGKVLFQLLSSDYLSARSMF